MNTKKIERNAIKKGEYYMIDGVSLHYGGVILDLGVVFLKIRKDSLGKCWYE